MSPIDCANRCFVAKKQYTYCTYFKQWTLSGQFLQESLFAAVDAIVGAIVTSHTHRNVMNQPKYGQIINCGLTTLTVSLFSLWRLRITTQITADMALLKKWPVFLQNASGNPRFDIRCGQESISNQRSFACSRAGVQTCFDEVRG